MRFRKFTNSNINSQWKLMLGPYDQQTASDNLRSTQTLIDNVTPTVIFSANLFGQRSHIDLVNSSTGGQIIRYGLNPSFGAPIKGIPMLPGQGKTLKNWNLSITAIGSAAGGLLDIFIASSSP